MFPTLTDIRGADKSFRNRMRFIYLQSRVKDFRALSEIHPFDKLDEQAFNNNMELLRPYHIRYVSEVSTPGMAASLELAAFLLSLCQASSFKKVADLGSGFTSFVLRYYAKSVQGVEIYSVDDDAQWLEKTRRHLADTNVSDDHLMTLPEFLDSNPQGFDCILHDLNFVEVRVNYVTRLLPMLSSNGILVLDDMHKAHYRYKVLKELHDRSWNVYGTGRFTRDSFGRYSMIALKP
jgi:predicted O-methyltransferase YrrM